MMGRFAPAFTLVLVALAASPAEASVSIAVVFDTLVGTADSVAVVSPIEQKSQWEDGRIFTYTRVKVENGVAGELGVGQETWVRSRGGTVGNIGQLVDGEPSFPAKTSSLVFLRHGPAGTFEVSARAQGQYPLAFDAKLNVPVVQRNAQVGVLMMPKTTIPNASAGITIKSEVLPPLAGETLHGKPLSEAVRLILDSRNKQQPK
jgi:hypothetical protein